MDLAVDAIAHQAVAEAMTRAPVDTGALRASLHVEPGGRSGERIVADGVDYGIYNEFGTVKMAAHPFLLPGVLAAVRDFAATVGKWVFHE